ncbi:MAG: 16S rRNA (uracil(1498)-N(3))-methyltransferase [Clostridiales bacterium]|nr:16S rRNA (uracil(1498)-N(3))-methyltransferase [Clostridiales bacterium]
MNRFFIDNAKIVDSHTEIIGHDAGHILRVLRLGIGDSIELCDGAGMDYPTTIVETDKDRLRVKLGEGRPSKGEPSIRVTLYQGIPKSTKMDLIVQKCVELGIYRIVPLDTARTITKLSDPKKAKKRVARWQKISEEAAKQSRRGIIPKVDVPISYSSMAESASHSAKIILWEGERDVALRQCLERAKHSSGSKADIGIVIGPEGGLDHDEVVLAKEHGWETASLGSRILRTETAGMAALAATMFYMEEME